MSTIAERASVHAALGEPSRLAVVETLVDSDRSVSELVTRLRIPGNLLAHHLDVLERAGVIERAVSSGDARRRYVRLRPRALDALRPVAVPVVPSSVLFICTHNSARSQLAAALWRHHTGTEARSAGTHPSERVHPKAAVAARRHGLDLVHVRPRRFEPGDLSSELVVTVCDRAHEELTPRARWRHWSIVDPVDSGTQAAFDAALELIDGRVRLAAGTAA